MKLEYGGLFSLSRLWYLQDHLAPRLFRLGS